MYISQKENINLTLDKMAHLISKYDGNIKNILWILQIYKVNDVYIDNIINNLDILKTLFSKINVNFDSKYYIDIIKRANDDNIFIYKNINKFINQIGNEIYDLLIKNIKQYIPKNMFDEYFTSTNIFLNKITKTNYKSIKYINIEKKLKLDDIIFKIKSNLYELLIHIRLLDPNLSSDAIMIKLYKFIKSCDIKLMNEMRNIIFNLLITNIKGTEIIKMILHKIINDEKINVIKKNKIINIAKDTEYGIIKGRREINQYDNFLINVINILSS
jgi:hypothetical protein